MEKRLGITMGDAAGVGPEIILKVAEHYLNDMIVYGSYDVLSHYNDVFSYAYPLNRISVPEEAVADRINIIDPSDLKYNDFNVGEVSDLCGKNAYLFLENAIHDALDRKIAAIVTCPLNKEALRLGGYDFAGHTEILSTLCNTNKYVMPLWSDTIKTIHVSTHVALSEAIHRVRKDRIMEVTMLAYDVLKKAGYEDPRIAIAGLNPHAGENGLFGREEIDEILPAIEALKQSGINVYGPISPDTVFMRCQKGDYDLVVAMYHDQGHIPLKLADFDGGVNITCGLPIIRTSVDHGTAFDIAGKNIARPDSLMKAIEAARILSANE